MRALQITGQMVRESLTRACVPGVCVKARGPGGCRLQPVSRTDAPWPVLGVQALEAACQQALAPWIHDQRAQRTKTGCLQKMLSIINHVYQAIKGSGRTRRGRREWAVTKDNCWTALVQNKLLSSRALGMQRNRISLLFVMAACTKMMVQLVHL